MADYPASSEVTLDLRPFLHPLFQGLNAREPSGGISEFTFANIYLFRHAHEYRVSILEGGLVLITGRDREKTFFMLPLGLPEKDAAKRLFKEFSFMKAATGAQAEFLRAAGYTALEDRDNFDYLYSRAELARLPGRRFHKKKNLVNAFLGQYRCEGMPLTDDRIKDALRILEDWSRESRARGDYIAAKEALEKAGPLQLCGGIYYVDGKPAAYALGEELGTETFAVHFEKGIGGIKGLNPLRGLMQFVNMSFAEILPSSYKFVNREQDLGDDGLRQAKESYRPVGFIKKYMITTTAP
ncbi:MAG: DUF2156 domain-containing protein [Deltaproteobacteria bacterium]|nr:DUF2156 domain-containing protein [Deltaproteobacteria bacterium]